MWPDRFSCDGVPPLPNPLLGINKSWSDMRANLQEHVRLLTDDRWPEDARTGRRAALWEEYNAGIGVMHLGNPLDSLWPGPGGPPCGTFSCAACPIGEITLRLFALLCMDRSMMDFFFVGARNATRQRGAPVKDLDPSNKMQAQRDGRGRSARGHRPGPKSAGVPLP